jgi:hypothetical protein
MFRATMQGFGRSERRCGFLKRIVSAVRPLTGGRATRPRNCRKSGGSRPFKPTHAANRWSTPLDRRTAHRAWTDVAFALRSLK